MYKSLSLDFSPMKVEVAVGFNLWYGKGGMSELPSHSPIHSESETNTRYIRYCMSNYNKI